MIEAPYCTLYVSRIVPLPVGHVAQVFDRLPPRLTSDARSLVFDPRPEMRSAHWSGDPWRCVRADLRPGRLRLGFAVEVEALPWSHECTEIAIHPLGRRCLRARLFCEAARTVVDHLADGLVIGALGVGALRAGAPLWTAEPMRRAS